MARSPKRTRKWDVSSKRCSRRERGFCIFRRRDPLFDEGIPLVALRALPQKLRAPVAAPDADVGIEIEDGVPSQLDVSLDERGRQIELRERLPDGLMQCEGVWIVNQRLEDHVERVACAAA